METMYDRIKNLRISENMSQEDLAKKVGYKGRSMISRIESGEIDISQSKVAAFAAALGTTIQYIMDGDPADDAEKIIHQKHYIKERIPYTNEDQIRLEALHNNPRLGLLFDHSSKMAPEDVDFMIQMAERIVKERERD